VASTIGVFQFSSAPIRPNLCLLSLLAIFWVAAPSDSAAQAGGGASAVSSQTRQDNQLTRQVQATGENANTQNLEEESVTARPLSGELGDVQIISEIPHKPWFYITVDCQAFYNSNVLYAESGGQKFSAWQIITTPEIGFAPQIQDEQYAMFFPKAGFRYQFFTYATAEPGSPPYNQTGISQNNFTVIDPFISLGWSFSEDLFITFSADANVFNGSGRDPSLTQYVNFLNEYPLAWQATWYHKLASWTSTSITGRASYVLANPSNFTRTDNNLTFSWSTNPTEQLSTQAYASFRLAKYTGTQLEDQFNNADRLDFQQTYGVSITYTPFEYVSLRGFVSWTKSDSSVSVPETGDYEALNAGTGINLIYKF